MIWLTWRQFRTQAIIAASALSSVGIALLITGVALRHRCAHAGIGACHAHSDCERLATNFLSQVHSASIGPYDLFFSASIVVLYAVPALIGLFWAGNRDRELRGARRTACLVLRLADGAPSPGLRARPPRAVWLPGEQRQYGR